MLIRRGQFRTLEEAKARINLRISISLCGGNSLMSLNPLNSGSSACTAMILSSCSPWSIICMTPIGFALRKDIGTTGSCTHAKCLARVNMDLLQHAVCKNLNWHPYREHSFEEPALSYHSASSGSTARSLRLRSNQT